MRNLKRPSQENRQRIIRLLTKAIIEKEEENNFVDATTDQNGSQITSRSKDKIAVITIY